MLALMLTAALAAPLQVGVTGVQDAQSVNLLFADAAQTTSACVEAGSAWACEGVDVERPVDLGLVIDKTLVSVGTLSEAGGALTLRVEDGAARVDWTGRVEPASGGSSALLMIRVEGASADQAPMLRLRAGGVSMEVGCADDGSFPDSSPDDGRFHCLQVVPQGIVEGGPWLLDVSTRGATGEDLSLGQVTLPGGGGARFVTVTIGAPEQISSAPFAVRVMPRVKEEVEGVAPTPPEAPPEVAGEPEPPPQPQPEPPPQPQPTAAPDVVPAPTGVPVLWTVLMLAMGFFAGHRVGRRQQAPRPEGAEPVEVPPIGGHGPRPEGDPVVVAVADSTAAVGVIVEALTPHRRLLVSGEASLEGVFPGHPIHRIVDVDMISICNQVSALLRDGGVPPVVVLVGTEPVIDSAGGTPSPAEELLERLCGRCWVVWVVPEHMTATSRWARWGYDAQAGWSVL